MFLRAGGAIGGGGGGGGGGHFRSHLFRDAFDGTEGMSVGEGLAALGYYVIVYLLYAASIIVSLLVAIIVRRRKKNARKETRRMMAEYDDFDGFWSYDYVQNRINEVYFAVQNAWTDGDMKKVEDMLTEGLLNKYQKHLDAMKRDGERNVMENVRLIKAEPVYAKDFTHNEHDYLWARIDGVMSDYVINKDSGNILEGTKEALPFTEYWKFTRRRDGNWVLAEIMQQEEFEKTHYYKSLSKL